MSEFVCELTDARYEMDWELKEKIVRCRDCKYWATEARFTGMCVGKQLDPEGFCKWGEKCERESAEVWNQWSADDITCSEES